VDDDRALAYLMLFGVGGLFILIGLSFLVGMVGLPWRYVRATATVVGHVGDDRTAGRGPALLPPVVEFEDAGGVRHRVPVPTGIRLVPYPVGTRVRVRYARGNPGRVRLPPTLLNWAFPVAFTVLGFVAVALGVVVRVYNLPVDGTEVSF
jgi:hypothetical protein